MQVTALVLRKVLLFHISQKKKTTSLAFYDGRNIQSYFLWSLHKLYTFVKTHQTIHMKRLNFMYCTKPEFLKYKLS